MKNPNKDFVLIYIYTFCAKYFYLHILHNHEIPPLFVLIYIYIFLSTFIPLSISIYILCLINK